MLISVLKFYLRVLKNNGYPCHVLYMKIISEIKRNSSASGRTCNIKIKVRIECKHQPLRPSAGTTMPNFSSVVAHCTSDARKRKRKPNDIAKTVKGFATRVSSSCLLLWLAAVAAKEQQSYRTIKFATQNLIFYTLHGFTYCLVYPNESIYRYTFIKISRK